MEVILKAVDFARHLVEKSLKAGERAIDATTGNGNDTEWLAHLVGEKGEVYAFDIQEEAIKNTREKLSEKKILSRVHLIPESHQYLEKHVPPGAGAVMFNLGYLPGSNRRIITRPESTIAALGQSIELLREGGVITLVIYTGHAGGEKEEQKIFQYLTGISQKNFSVLSYRFINQAGYPPQLVALEKKQNVETIKNR